jgi:hypothetical protein
MKYFLLLFFIFFNNPTKCYIDVFFDLGYSNIKTPFNDKVDLIHVGSGLTLAYGSQFFAGVLTEYRALTRLVKTNEQLRLYKNQKSIIASPVIGFTLYDFIFKLYSTNLGYVFLKQEKDQNIASSTKASGIGFTILKKFGENWSFGSNYSTISYKEVDFKNNTDQSLNSTARMISASFILAYTL